jgi:hypothetical protein
MLARNASLNTPVKQPGPIPIMPPVIKPTVAPKAQLLADFTAKPSIEFSDVSEVRYPSLVTVFSEEYLDHFAALIGIEKSHNSNSCNVDDRVV